MTEKFHLTDLGEEFNAREAQRIQKIALNKSQQKNFRR